MLRIRLRRTGRKNRPNYRIVVAEHSAPIKGKYVEALGNFDPRTKQLNLNVEKIKKWLDLGAQPSNRMAKLLTFAKVEHKLIVVKTRSPRAPRKAEPEAGTEPKPEKKELEEKTEPAREQTEEQVKKVEQETVGMAKEKEDKEGTGKDRSQGIEEKVDAVESKAEQTESNTE